MKKTIYIFLLLFFISSCASVPSSTDRTPLKVKNAPTQKRTLKERATLNKASMKDKYRSLAFKKYKTGLSLIDRDPVLSEKYFLEALEIEPNYCEAYFNIGLIKMRANNDDAQALYLINKSSDTGCRTGEVFNAQGLIYLQRKDYKSAISSFSTAAKIHNFNAAYSNLASAYYGTKEFKKALESYKNALETEPNNAEILYNTALTLLEMEDFKNAEIFISRALNNAPNFARAKALKAEHMIYTGRIDDAVEYLVKESNLDPLNPDYHKNIGIIMELYKNDYRRAIAHYELFIKLSKGSNTTTETIKEVENWLSITKAKDNR